MNYRSFGVAKHLNDLKPGSLAIVPIFAQKAGVVMAVALSPDTPVHFGLLSDVERVPKFSLMTGDDLNWGPAIDVSECSRIVPTTKGLLAATPLSFQSVISFGNLILSDQKPGFTFRMNISTTAMYPINIDDGYRSDPSKVWNTGIRVPEWRIELCLDGESDWVPLVEGVADIVQGR